MPLLSFPLSIFTGGFLGCLCRIVEKTLNITAATWCRTPEVPHRLYLVSFFDLFFPAPPLKRSKSPPSRHVCRRSTYLKHVDFVCAPHFMWLKHLLASQTSPSNGTAAEANVCPWVVAFPVKATLPQLHRATLLMLQQLSAKWQMAASQRGSCKFGAGSLCKAGAIDWHASRSEDADAARAPPSPPHLSHTLCFQLLGGIQLSKTLLICQEARRETLAFCMKLLLAWLTQQ